MDLSDYEFSKFDYIQCKSCHKRIGPIKSKIEEEVNASTYVYNSFVVVAFVIATFIWFVVVFSEMNKLYGTNKIIRNFTRHG